jgi:hypothetical protein
MPIRLIICAFAAVVIAWPGSALGQDLPLGELQTTLREGDHIRILGTTGGVTTGRFDSLSAGSILLTVKGKAVTVPNHEVLEVRKSRREGDGVLIGMGIGAAAGWAFVHQECKDASERRDCLYAGRIVVGIPMAIVGALVDFGFKRYDTVFRKTTPAHTVEIAPLIGARRKGLTLRISF